MLRSQPHPSSTRPLQSLSIPSPQTTVAGLPGEHVCRTPGTQATAVLHAPAAPHVLPPRPSARPPLAPSSPGPLQSLSTPWQTSILAVPGTHGVGEPAVHAGTVT